MWNTKLLAKGKKVNREFAFISYSSQEEAATAIRCMHGTYVEGLTKDKDGLTVQYEAQGTGRNQQIITPPNIPIAGPSHTW
jgi:RNA recognition motif-containing protein